MASEKVMKQAERDYSKVLAVLRACKEPTPISVLAKKLRLDVPRVRRCLVRLREDRWVKMYGEKRTATWLAR